MSIDTKQLSEQNEIKTLLVTKGILDKKLLQIQGENRNLETTLKDERLNLNKLRSEIESFEEGIRQLDAVEIKDTSKKYEIQIIDANTMNNDLTRIFVFVLIGNWFAKCWKKKRNFVKRKWNLKSNVVKN